MAREGRINFEQKLNRLREFRQDAERLLARARQLSGLWSGAETPSEEDVPARAASPEEHDRRRAAWTAQRRAAMGRRMRAYWAKRRSERQKAA